MTISSHPLPVPVLSALQYLMDYEIKLHGPDAEPNELTDSIAMLAMFVAHVTNTDPDHLFDMIGTRQDGIVIDANQLHDEPERLQ